MSSALAKITTLDKLPITNNFKKRRTRIISGKSGMRAASNSTPGILYSIGTPLEDINNSFKVLIKNNKLEDKRKREEEKKKKRDAREEKLEEAPTGIKFPKISNPLRKKKFKFFDKFTNFALFTFLGWLYSNFSLGGTGSLLANITATFTAGFFEVVNNTFMFLFDTFVFFVDQGYKIHDSITGALNKVEGKDDDKVHSAPKAKGIFDNFTNELKKLSGLFAISGATVLAVMGGTKLLANSLLGEANNPEPDAKKPDTPGKKSGKVPKKPKGKFGKVRQIARLTSKKASRKAALRVLRPALKKLSIIGRFIDFGVSVALGEPLGRAAFSLIGSSLLGVIGAGLGGFVGAILGGMAGDYIGAKLYDVFFEGKKNVAKDKTQKANSGGRVARKKKRKIVKSKAPKRSIKSATVNVKKPIIYDEPMRPGRSVGGKNAITKLFPDTEDPWSFRNTINRVTGRDTMGTPNPYGALEKISGVMRRIPFKGVGSIMASTVDMLLGQMPTKKVFDNLANAVLYVVQSFNSENASQLISRISTFASGGEVPSERSISLNSGMMDNTQLSRVLERSISPKMKESLDILRKEISKKTYDKDAESGSNGPGGGESGESGGGMAGGAIDAPMELVSKMGFSQNQWNIFRNSVALIESGGDYSAHGGSGKHYDGRYQMGRDAKIDAARILRTQFPGHDTGSRSLFRSNKEMQERFFAAYTMANHNYLMRNPKYRDASPERRLQILGYAHNQGMGGATTWLNTGVVGSDGFGTDGTEYTDLIAKNFRAASNGGHLNVAGGGIEFDIKGGIKPSTRLGDRVGMRKHPITGQWKMHQGDDIPMPIGTPIRILKGGVVTRSEVNGSMTSGYGNLIEIKHDDGTTSAYAHLDERLVKVGQKVNVGTLIGKVGSTGGSTGSHLHFEKNDANGNLITSPSALAAAADKTFVLGDAKVSPKEVKQRLAKKHGVEGVIVKENGKDVWQAKVWTPEEKENYRKQQEKNKPSRGSRPSTAGGNPFAPGPGSSGYGGGDNNTNEKPRYRNRFERRRGNTSSLIQPQINSNNISRFASYNNPMQTAKVLVQPVIIKQKDEQLAKTMGYPHIASGSVEIPSMNLDMGRA
jgi:murein DD-endopeptidase MepM/ murein hydrolase activator NlpD